MVKRRKKDGLAAHSRGLADLLTRFGCRLVDQADIAREIETRRGDRAWPGMARFLREEGAKWVNDQATLVFQVPLANLTGGLGLYFAQEVWMIQPSLFEYVELGDQGFVRLWWKGDQGSAPLPPPG